MTLPPPETAALIDRSDEHRLLGMDVPSWRAPEIRDHMSHAARPWLRRLRTEPSAESQSIAALARISLAMYRLVDPRRRTNPMVRAWMGRLDAGNPINDDTPSHRPLSHPSLAFRVVETPPRDDASRAESAIWHRLWDDHGPGDDHQFQRRAKVGSIDADPVDADRGIARPTSPTRPAWPGNDIWSDDHTWWFEPPSSVSPGVQTPATFRSSPITRIHAAMRRLFTT